MLKANPHLRKQLTKCKHCRIFFITNPRNYGRTDLGCPFGCADNHRRKESIRRSTEYYKTEEGKIKKRELNRKRIKQEFVPEEPMEVIQINERIIQYLQRLTSQIEGRKVRRDEVILAITEKMRQPSIEKTKRMCEKADTG
jgi:hypothetical protein